MFNKTRVVALNGGFVAQFKKDIFCEWASYNVRRNGEKHYTLEAVIKNCLHDNVEAAKATLLLMTPVEIK